MAKWLLVLSALVAVSTAAITTTNQVKHLDDKKCIVCYGHIASAYMECIQATIKHPGEPDKASEECNRATDDAMTYCPDNCLHKPKGFYGASNLGLEKPSKYFAVKDTPQQDKCNVCYGSIATAFMECLQGSYAHRDRPEMVEQLCNEATEQAYKRCSSDGCMKKAKGCGLKTEDFLLKAEEAEKSPVIRANSVSVAKRGKKHCRKGATYCQAEQSGESTCCPKGRACCGQYKWRADEVCCKEGWCCNRKKALFVTSCVPPELC